MKPGTHQPASGRNTANANVTEFSIATEKPLAGDVPLWNETARMI